MAFAVHIGPLDPSPDACRAVGLALGGVPGAPTGLGARRPNSPAAIAPTVCAARVCVGALLTFLGVTATPSRRVIDHLLEVLEVRSRVFAGHASDEVVQVTGRRILGRLGRCLCGVDTSGFRHELREHVQGVSRLRLPASDTQAEQADVAAGPRAVVADARALVECFLHPLRIVGVLVDASLPFAEVEGLLGEDVDGMTARRRSPAPNSRRCSGSPGRP